MKPTSNQILNSSGAWRPALATLAAVGAMALAGAASADNLKLDRAFNEPGNILIADQGNNRAIEVTRGDKIGKTFTAGGTANIVAFARRARLVLH